VTATAQALTSLHPLQSREIDARNRTDVIFEIISKAALYDRPIAERHRLIFYLGHLEAFDWNLLGRRAFGLESEHPALDKLFAFGIDPTDGNLPNDQPSDWPEETAVRNYVESTRRRIDENLAERLASPSAKSAELEVLLNVAIEHRLMHAETLAYLLHQLPYDKKNNPGPNPVLSNGQLKSHFVEIPEGTVALGLPGSGSEGQAAGRNGETFGWDNEFEENQQHVPGFRISAYPVTNGEYLEFFRAGGYNSEKYWRPGDWAWKTSAGVTHPYFWIARGNDWNYRGMFEEFPLPLGWPVYMSCAEAVAYARWAGKSLPSEAQWHRAAYGSPQGDESAYPWGNDAPDSAHGNFDFISWDPTPVCGHPKGASRFGVFDLLGNGWEWTSSIFQPFPGFEPFSFYQGYSANFFDGNHFVMKGGSPRTAACMLRRSFRNWFQPHYPYVYAKFRCVEG
jgi:gamma-glutamyl hercynylcysteine S-oxide synthase